MRPTRKGGHGGRGEGNRKRGAHQQGVHVAALGALLLAFTVHGQELALPDRMVCTAEQTAGFHDYPHNELGYEAVVFFESSFTLRVNKVLMQHLAPQSQFDAYLTLTDQEGEVGELQCRRVRGAGNAGGLSCSTAPPADLLLLNLDNLRFTRTAIGGWTFGTAETSTGQSIFVEYGRCTGA